MLRVMEAMQDRLDRLTVRCYQWGLARGRKKGNTFESELALAELADGRISGCFTTCDKFTYGRDEMDGLTECGKEGRVWDFRIMNAMNVSKPRPQILTKLMYI